jgi:hypothetical protein
MVCVFFFSNLFKIKEHLILNSPIKMKLKKKKNKIKKILNKGGISEYI